MKMIRVDEDQDKVERERSSEAEGRRGSNRRERAKWYPSLTL